MRNDYTFGEIEEILVDYLDSKLVQKSLLILSLNKWILMQIRVS